MSNTQSSLSRTNSLVKTQEISSVKTPRHVAHCVQLSIFIDARASLVSSTAKHVEWLSLIPNVMACIFREILTYKYPTRAIIPTSGSMEATTSDANCQIFAMQFPRALHSNNDGRTDIKPFRKQSKVFINTPQNHRNVMKRNFSSFCFNTDLEITLFVTDCVMRSRLVGATFSGE